MVSLNLLWSQKISTNNNGINLLKIIQGEHHGDMLGRSLESAGDINQDGYDDIMIGAPWADSLRGYVYIYFGCENLDTMKKITLYGENYGDHFGEEIANLGDINRDGNDDFLINAPCFELHKGKVYLYLGTGTESLELGKTYEGKQQSERYGVYVRGGGDINGDGYNDFLIERMPENYTLPPTSIDIYFGGKTIPDEPGLVLRDTTDCFGWELEMIGDVNNDGYADVAVGGRSADINGFDAAGYFKVYFGSARMDTIPDIEVYGSREYHQLGNCFCSGDFNGDGVTDFIVGSNGQGYVYFGNSNIDSIPDMVIGNTKIPCGYVGTAGDITGNGCDELLSGNPGWGGGSGVVDIYLGSANFDTIPDVRIYGQYVSYFGEKLSTAGDINGDGLDEFLVGEPQYFLGIFNQGRVYVYSGDSTLLGIEDSGKIPTNPVKFNLLGNYPNPFNPRTTIAFDLPEESHVTLTIYDVMGREIVRLLDENQPAGFRQVIWDGKDKSGQTVSSGNYLYTLKTPAGFSETKKMALMR